MEPGNYVQQILTPPGQLLCSPVFQKETEQVASLKVFGHFPLDDFRMYDRAITPAEVEGLFALGKSFISKKAKGSVTLKVITKTANNNAAAGTKSLSVKVDVLGLNDSILASYPLKKPGNLGFSKGSVETFVFGFL